VERAGFIVEEAENGGQVIDAVAAHRPDVIVLDLAIPVLDGLKVCRRLKADDRTAAIPIIIFTGHTLPGIRETVERAGADAFLARPCSPATLVAAIQLYTGPSAADVLPLSFDDPSRSALSRFASPAEPSAPAQRPRYRCGLYATVAAVVFAIGIAQQFGLTELITGDNRLNELAEASIDQHQKLVSGLLPPAIAGVSPQAAEDWFRQRVDFKVVLPDLKDPKITLVGAHVSRLADADVAAIDHQLDRHRVSLFMIPEKAYNQLALGEDPRFKLVKSRGFT